MPVIFPNGTVSQGVYSFNPTSTVASPTVIRALRFTSRYVTFESPISTLNGHFIGWPSAPRGPVRFDSTRPSRTTITYCCPPMRLSVARGFVE